MSTDEAVSFGRYTKFLIQLYKDEGPEVLFDFLSQEDDFSAQMALAYLIQGIAEQR